MNTIAGTGRPLRNSQGICNTSQHPMGYTTPPLEAQSILVNPQFSRSVLTENGSHQASSTASTPPSVTQVESFTPCVRQNDRFDDPSGSPLQPGTVIVCDNLPFVVSNNGKIYNFMEGSMKQLYVADPSEQKFLVTSANSPSTFSNIFSSVLGLFPRFSNRQNDTNKHKDEDQKQSATEASTIETIHTTNSNIGMSISTSAETIQDVSNLANLSADVRLHHDVHDTLSHHRGLFQNSTCNEMLTHYNRIVFGCFKDFFQSVNTNNLAEVLQALKELNFVLANRALELAVHYNMMLELHQISAEEVPDLVKAHLHCTTAYNPEHSIRGRPHSQR